MRDARPVLPLRTWLTASHLVVFALPIVVLVATGALARDLRNQTRWDLEHQAALVALHVESELRHAGASTALSDLEEPLSATLRAIKEQTLAGLRVTDARGVVVASSGSGIGSDLSADEEVRAALEGGVGFVVRARPSGRTRMPLASESRNAGVRLFVARPIRGGDAILGAVVLSRTPREELQAIYQMAPERLLVGALLALLATVGLAVASAWIPTRSLRLVASGSHRIAAGRFEGLGALVHPTGSHVAEVRATAVAVRTMAARLQERLAYITEFASNVSHEFKTPLSTLRGTLELLGDDDEMPPEQRARFLANATAELDRLERLVTGLLALARAEEARPDEVLDLGALAAAVAERNGVPVEARPVRVRGDRAQLETAIENLVANARRYGGETVQVRVRVEPTRVAVEVNDDGPGISEANRARVFDRFFTTDRAGGGTGLGLALVKAVATAHGGTVEVESRPGDTRFRVWVAR